MPAYKAFVIDDPTPWLDQLIETVGVMVKKCGGSSVEFVISTLLRNRGHPHHIILAATEEGRPDVLVAWMLISYVHDTKSPWVEVWGLWCKPGSMRALEVIGASYLEEWATGLGATKVLAILTRNTQVFLKILRRSAGFEQIGIVIEKELKSGDT